MITTFVTDSQEALDAASAANVVNVWIHGSSTIIETSDDVQVTDGVVADTTTTTRKKK